MYASKCWPLKSSDLERQKRNERSMLRWLYNIKPEVRVCTCTSALYERLRICNLEKALQIRCLIWYRHVQYREVTPGLARSDFEVH